jgi:predicted transcriptional regulator
MTDKPTREHQSLLAHLDKVLTDKTQTAIADRILLRDAVCEYVSVEQARGTPLRGILAAIKEILRKAEKGSVKATDALARQLINWCLEFHRPAEAH